MKQPPGTYLLVKHDENREAIITCVGVTHVFIRYLPLDMYSHGRSVPVNINEITLIGTYPKKSKSIGPIFGEKKAKKKS